MAKFWIGVTDRNWYDFLRVRDVEDVNFWQPSATNQFRALGEGDLFLFKLHYPLHAIVGGGVFLRSHSLPAFLAWDTFGHANGASSRSELYERIEKYTKKPVTGSHEIGCRILCEPFFFDEHEWIRPTGGLGEEHCAGQDDGRIHRRMCADLR